MKLTKIKSLVAAVVSLWSVAALAETGEIIEKDFSGTLNLCVGDVFNYWAQHSEPYRYELKSNSDGTVANGTAPYQSKNGGLFFTIKALKAGTTTIVFDFKRSQIPALNTYTATMTVNVSEARVLNPGAQTTVSGWGSGTGISDWKQKVDPSGFATVEIGTHTKNDMTATLTMGQNAGSGTVTIDNCSNSSGSEYIYAVTVTEPALLKYSLPSVFL